MEDPMGSVYTFIGKAAPPAGGGYRVAGDRGYNATPGPVTVTDGAEEGPGVAQPTLPPAVGGEATYIVTKGLPLADTPTV
jgi:hypothetical protein